MDAASQGIMRIFFHKKVKIIAILFGGFKMLFYNTRVVREAISNFEKLHTTLLKEPLSYSYSSLTQGKL